jgi:formylglycine-generating enzyme required for sulfatase activity
MKNLIRVVAGMLALTVAMEAGAQCTGDLTFDARVDGSDLGRLLSWWGPVVTSSLDSLACDLDRDGFVNGADLGILLSNWGYCPPTAIRVSPSEWCLTGSTKITITGTYLTTMRSVTIGGVPATNVTVLDQLTVTALTPPGSLGSADVVLSGAAGTVTLPAGFRYVPIRVPAWATLVEADPDPAVVTDPAMRAAISSTCWAWRVRDTATQTELLLVPPGVFQMGCAMPTDANVCQSYSLPVHQVTLTKPFYLGRYEVTQAQWAARMGSNPSRFQASDGFPGSDDRPVERVSWTTIQSYLAATGMRLPTEAEWEYACRAGTQTPFYNGTTDDNTLVGLAWCGANANNQTHTVGLKSPNALGFHDMYGNVWEWVKDWAGSYAGAIVDPTGPGTGTLRGIRGGSWFTDSYYSRSCARSSAGPNYLDFSFGFRVARNP